jgi:hypothetical protein
MNEPQLQPFECYCGHQLAQVGAGCLIFFGSALIAQTVRLHCPQCGRYKQWHPEAAKPVALVLEKYLTITSDQQQNAA